MKAISSEVKRKNIPKSIRDSWKPLYDTNDFKDKSTKCSNNRELRSVVKDLVPHAVLEAPGLTENMQDKWYNHLYFVKLLFFQS